MPLPASGVITMGDVNTELGLSPTVSISLNDTIVRNLFVKPTGAISLDDGHGKSSLLPIEDVFCAYTYTGTGATQTITTGIDLPGKSGLVWLKNRDTPGSHLLFDTVRGADNLLQANLSNPSVASVGYMTTFTASGFGLTSSVVSNSSGNKYISWTFRKAPKFFDVVTYTGNGAGNQTIAHSLGVAPGMIIVKSLSAAGYWWVYHNSTSATPNSDHFNLNSSNAVVNGGGSWNATSTGFYAQAALGTNTSSVTYVAYLFAHDTGADGLIQCGSFTGTGAGKVINLGWEAQYVMVKPATDVGGWYILDQSREMGINGFVGTLDAGVSGTEVNSGLKPAISATATGFIDNGLLGTDGRTLVYMAIRRGPMKKPTVGTQVYNAIARTGTSAAAVSTGAGFPPDLAIVRNTDWFQTVNRLNGAGRFHRLQSAVGVQKHEPFNTLTNFTMTGASFGTDTWYHSFNVNTENYTDHFFRRYPGVFDFIIYRGTYSATTTPHNLKVVPEMMIVREVENNCDWGIYHKDLGNTYRVFLNQPAALVNDTLVWNSTTPTNSVVSLGASNLSNGTEGYDAYHHMYLFATLAGISKVGSYTGNGSSQTIDCGFTTGARFILIKQSAANTPWRHWNTMQGITAGDDPYSNISSMGAPISGTDSIDPDSSGFIANQVAASSINVTGATYIYLAFA